MEAAMKNYVVIAEMVDSETGKRLFPAAADEEPVTFTPHSDEQAERLVGAGCIDVAPKRGTGEDEPKSATATPAKQATKGRTRR
jgi:hypothetical protein